jgi:site-specific DNA recombinase
MNKKTVRCVVYTRKSTEEGLKQEFNSLDAQREAGEAYIQSQKHEGWICLPDRYDDGGFSGGNIERPALKRLMEDVKAGKIDTLVTYKVDRLSRSLLDFAKLMEVFEQYNVSFVSVTQQFCSANSMGRLTLNILLSFAQYEREIIAERTRDKMSAARRKGKWVGGIPMLGYDVDPQGGKLLVNKEEAAKVQVIYELYLEKQSLISTVKELNSRGWTTKAWTTKKGKKHNGKPFDKNNLFSMLTNVIYMGKVNHKGTIYEGAHEAIIDEETWRKVQSVLRRNGRNGGKTVRNKYGALLKGLLYCQPCKTAMVHTYTQKNENKRYRYYVCSKAQKQGWDTCPTKSLPAAEIEKFVIEQIRCIGTDNQLLTETIEQAHAHNKKHIEELKREQSIKELELKRYNTEMRSLIGSDFQNIDADSPATTKLADLQDSIRIAEKCISNIRTEIIMLYQETVDEEELSVALSHFDPARESLSMREQARIIHLLVERVGYDGESETIALTFRPAAIKALAKETNF